MLKELVNQLGHELSMKEDILTLTPDHTHYTIPLEDIQVEAIQLEHSYLLKGIIGDCPQVNKEAFLMRIMEANLFGKGTRGAAIGLNEEGNLLTLSLELDYNSSYKDFKDRLEDFISVIDFWRKEALNHQ